MKIKYIEEIPTQYKKEFTDHLIEATKKLNIVLQDILEENDWHDFYNALAEASNRIDDALRILEEVENVREFKSRFAGNL